MGCAKLGQTLLYVSDVEQAAAFYERVFGMTRTLVDPSGIYIALASGGATLAFADARWVAGNGLAFAPIDAHAQPSAVEINVFVDDVESRWRAAIAAGATAWLAPTPQPWGQIVAYVRDPNGFLVEIATFPPKRPRTPDDSAARLSGGCHCGNLTVSFEPSRPLAALAARACTCTFCAPRRLRWTSDPEGRVEIAIADERETSRYRFGTSTADFLVCRRCGSVVAAVGDGSPLLAVINIDVLDRAGDFADAEPRSFDGEDVQSRLARRARSWTPATVRSASVSQP